MHDPAVLVIKCMHWFDYSAGECLILKRWVECCITQETRGQPAVWDISYLMRLWQQRHHNLSRMIPRTGWWSRWRACKSAGWSIQCFASAWSSKTVEGRHLQTKVKKEWPSLIQEEHSDVLLFVSVPMAMPSWTGFITMETSKRGSYCKSLDETKPWANVMCKHHNVEEYSIIYIQYSSLFIKWQMFLISTWNSLC